jgi:hypothetical protein
MRAEDVRDNTTKLNEVLRETGLRWVVEEVSRVIEHGVEEKRIVSFETFTLDGLAIPRKGPKSEVTATRPYTEEEQLDLVLEAVENVLIDGAEIRASIFEKLAKDIPNAQVRFEPDVPSDIQERGFAPLPEDQGAPFIVTQDVANESLKASTRLRHTISSTKEELSAG